ncbi:MAG: hypothetical protein QW222_06590 [Candidatus Bathyarchaeia archaeon]
MPFLAAYRRMPFFTKGNLSLGGDLLRLKGLRYYDGGRLSPVTPLMNVFM